MPKVIRIFGHLGSVEIPRSNLKGLIKICNSNHEIFCSNKKTFQVFREKISGIEQGYLFQLELHGLGFRVQAIGTQTLVFKLGFSHTIHYVLPKDTFCFVQNPNEFNLFGIDKQKLSQIAGQIKLLRAPDVYKGKGIRRSNDIIYLRSTLNKN